MGKDKSWLLAHLEHNLSAKEAKLLDEQVQRRAAGEPLAYIRGFVEFYGRNFAVSPDVLIPRPETEALIVLAKHLPLPAHTTVIDVGTGSGCIAATLKLEKPSWEVIATDISAGAIKIALKNARRLNADIQFIKADLLGFDLAPKNPGLITANLPYVGASWETSGTDFEPSVALYADDNGLALIKELITQSAKAQVHGGFLLLEADPRQHDDIIAFAHAHAYSWYATEGYGIVLERTKN